MTKVTTTISTTKRQNLVYYVGIAEKQNESGIMFNQRLFFLLSNHHIGYFSQASNQQLQKINFQKSKKNVLLKHIKSVSKNQNIINIKFGQSDQNKSFQKSWILRLISPGVATQWYDLIQKQKIQISSSIQQSQRKSLNKQQKVISSQSRSPVNKSKVNQPISVKKQKNLEIVSNNLAVNQQFKIKSIIKEQKKQTKQIGTLMSPKVSNLSQSKSKIDYTQQLRKISHARTNQQQDFSLQKQDKKIEGSHTDRLIIKQKTKQNSIVSEPAYKKSKNLSQKYSEIKKPQYQQSNKNPSENNKGINNSLYLNKQKQKIQQDNLKKSNVSNDLQIPNLPIIKNHLLQTKYKKQKIIQQSQINFDSLKTSRQKQSQKNNQKQPWTYKFIKHKQQIFVNFKQHCSQLFKKILEDIHLQDYERKYRTKMFKKNIYYLQVQDIQVKLALIGLQGINKEDGTQRVCNKASIKLLKNQFNNFKALYNYLQSYDKLQVPLICLCQYMGNIGLFKANVQGLTMKAYDISYDLNIIRQICKFQFELSQSNIAVKLDEKYYKKYQQSQQELNLNLIFIHQVDNFLPFQKITEDQQNKQIFHINLVNQTIQKQKHSFINKKQLSAVTYKNLYQKISQMVIQIDNMDAYFLNSKQISGYFHKNGVNIKYLGILFQYLKTTYQKRIIMTQMAARSCKTLLRKTFQDIILEQQMGPENQIINKLCDFLNCLFGNTYQTAAIWKVLSAHSKYYFGMYLNFDLIDKSHFTISVIQNCLIKVDWTYINPQQSFKNNNIFSTKSIKGTQLKCTTYPLINNTVLNTIGNILQQEESHNNFQLLIKILKYQDFQKYQDHVKLKIKKYLSLYVSPQKAQSQQFSKFNIYQFSLQYPSKIQLQKKLLQIKWNLKQGNKQKYIKNSDQLIQKILKYFGDFHPILTQLYDLSSAYHLLNLQYEDALTFAKSSLVNILKICGSNHNKTSQCYFHLALCYMKANKKQQAMSHMMKAKQIFQNNRNTTTLAYAVLLTKLSLLYLNQNLLNQSISMCNDAISIIESNQNQNQKYQTQLCNTYQILNRCYEIMIGTQQLKNLSQECGSKLSLFKIPDNIQKILKIYIYPKLASLDSSNSSSMIDLISSISKKQKFNQYQLAYQKIIKRIEANTFQTDFLNYIQKMSVFQSFIRQKKILQNWQGISNQYKRQSVQDVISLLTEITTFLGQGFVTGTLRQTL